MPVIKKVLGAVVCLGLSLVFAPQFPALRNVGKRTDRTSNAGKCMDRTLNLTAIVLYNVLQRRASFRLQCFTSFSAVNGLKLY